MKGPDDFTVLAGGRIYRFCPCPDQLPTRWRLESITPRDGAFWSLALSEVFTDPRQAARVCVRASRLSEPRREAMTKLIGVVVAEDREALDMIALSEPW